MKEVLEKYSNSEPKSLRKFFKGEKKLKGMRKIAVVMKSFSGRIFKTFLGIFSREGESAKKSKKSTRKDEIKKVKEAVEKPSEYERGVEEELEDVEEPEEGVSKLTELRKKVEKEREGEG